MPKILPNTGQKFSDVTKDQWFYPYIERGALYGIIQGRPDGNFYPNDAMSRAEVTTIVVKSFEKSVAISLLGNGATLIAIYFMLKKSLG